MYNVLKSKVTILLYFKSFKMNTSRYTLKSYYSTKEINNLKLYDKDNFFHKKNIAS